MARNKNVILKYSKAVAGAAGIPQARYIWLKVLKIDTYNFNDDRSLTEEKLSCETWDDCNSQSYHLRTAFYKRLNNSVLDYCRAIDPTCKLLRIYDRKSIYDLEQVTKICKSDRRNAIKKEHHVSNVASGALAKALDLNELFELGQDVGKLVMEQTIMRLPNHYSKEKKSEIAKELTMQTAIQLGREIGNKQAAEALVEILDFRPALINKDNQNDDLYSDNAKERRSKNNK